MPQIGIADKQTLDNTKTVVDSVNTKAGTNTDVAGTTTLFSRLRQIYEYLTGTILTAINGRQANWGAVAATKTNIDNTWSRINTNLDKKVSEIGGLNIKNCHIVAGLTNTHSSTTILNVTGQGYLLGIYGGSNTVQIQIDNGVIFTATTSSLSMLRFNTSIKITSNNSLINVFYSLD